MKVLISGGGPAGATAAYWLASQGIAVTVLEKSGYPREKVCGDGLTPRAVRQMQLMGLPHGAAEGYKANKGLRLVASGRTVIAITHDMDFAAEQFDRVVVMARGEVLADGPPGEVFGLADVLAAAAVEAPQLVRLAGRLGWQRRPLTPEQFVDAWQADSADG